MEITSCTSEIKYIKIPLPLFRTLSERSAILDVLARVVNDEETSMVDKSILLSIMGEFE